MQLLIYAVLSQTMLVKGPLMNYGVWLNKDKKKYEIYGYFSQDSNANQSMYKTEG